MVETFQEEGILRPRDAEILISENRKNNKLLEIHWLDRLWNESLSVSIKTDQFANSSRFCQSGSYHIARRNR
jgi:hypothetical protein